MKKPLNTSDNAKSIDLNQPALKTKKPINGRVGSFHSSQKPMLSNNGYEILIKSIKDSDEKEVIYFGKTASKESVSHHEILQLIKTQECSGVIAIEELVVNNKRIDAGLNYYKMQIRGEQLMLIPVGDAPSSVVVNLEIIRSVASIDLNKLADDCDSFSLDDSVLYFNVAFTDKLADGLYSLLDTVWFSRGDVEKLYKMVLDAPTKKDINESTLGHICRELDSFLHCRAKS